MENNRFKELLEALSQTLTAEEITLANIQASISTEIVKKRLSLGMNQKQFAEYMGFTQGIISRWENGETNFTLKTLVDIASKLNLSIQSPFVAKPPHKFYSTMNNNVVDFNEYRWKTQDTGSDVSYKSFELEEM